MSCSEDDGGWSDYFIKWMLKYPTADKIIAEADLRSSGLPVVLVRPTRLVDKPPRGL